jgi:hypothetical protein
MRNYDQEAKQQEQQEQQEQLLQLVRKKGHDINASPYHRTIVHEELILREVTGRSRANAHLNGSAGHGPEKASPQRRYSGKTGAESLTPLKRINSGQSVQK